MNVIFHINKEKRWPLVQGSVTHILAYCEQPQQNFHIEIAVNGGAVRQLKEKAVEQLGYKVVFCDFIKYGIIIAACHNAVEGQRMEEQEFLNGVTTVASGVVEFTVKWQAGYSCTKP